MQEAVDGGRLAGVVALITRGGQVAHFKAYGMQDRERAVLMACHRPHSGRSAHDGERIYRRRRRRHNFVGGGGCLLRNGLSGPDQANKPHVVVRHQDRQALRRSGGPVR
jgi:hypothetical protein